MPVRVVVSAKAKGKEADDIRGIYQESLGPTQRVRLLAESMVDDLLEELSKRIANEN